MISTRHLYRTAVPKRTGNMMTRTTNRVCGSRGPRIGEEGSPRCAQHIGHTGNHRGFIGSGFEREFWGDPIVRDATFAADWEAAGREPETTGTPLHEFGSGNV